MFLLQNKKLLILILFFILFIVILVVSLFSQGSSTSDVTINPTPTRQPVPTVAYAVPTVNLSATPLPGAFTGDSGEDVPETVAPGVKDSYSLQKKLPITTTDFVLTYNFEEIKFSVKLKPPVEESKKKFLEWLRQNEYQNIPQEEFIYSSQ